MGVTIRFDFDAAKVMGSLEVMPALVEAEAFKAMEISTLIAEAEIKALTPRKTGRLFSAWQTHVQISGGLTGIIANKVEYAGYVEDGTAPHEIVARGNALKFNVGGRTFFRKRVQHPGFLGRQMARLGLAIAKPAIIQTFRDAAKDAIRLALGK